MTREVPLVVAETRKLGPNIGQAAPQLSRREGHQDSSDISLNKETELIASVVTFFSLTDVLAF